MNRKESDLIARALHVAKPSKKAGLPAYEIWFNTVVSVKRELMAHGHLGDEERFLSLADNGIMRSAV